MTVANPAGPETAAALRAEHDELAKRLEVRTSIDLLRRALYAIFFGLIGAGTAVRLGWDRWGALKPGVVRKVLVGRPLFLWVATALAVGLLVAGIAWLLRARRLGREEDRLFARLRQLRAELGLDA